MSKERSIKKLTGKGRINRKQGADDLEPKSWWATSRRRFIVGGAVAAGVAVTGGSIWLATRDDTTEVDQDSLELQRNSGWNVGSEEKRLTFTGTQTVDSQGSANWTR